MLPALLHKVQSVTQDCPRCHLHIWFSSSIDGRYQSARLFGSRYARVIVPARPAVLFWLTIASVFLRPVPIAAASTPATPVLVLPDHWYFISVHASVPEVGAASRYLHVAVSVAPQGNVPPEAWT